MTEDQNASGGSGWNALGSEQGRGPEGSKASERVDGPGPSNRAPRRAAAELEEAPILHRVISGDTPEGLVQQYYAASGREPTRSINALTVWLARNDVDLASLAEGGVIELPSRKELASLDSVGSKSIKLEQRNRAAVSAAGRAGRPEVSLPSVGRAGPNALAAADSRADPRQAAAKTVESTWSAGLSVLTKAAELNVAVGRAVLNLTTEIQRRIGGAVTDVAEAQVNGVERLVRNQAEVVGTQARAVAEFSQMPPDLLGRAAHDIAGTSQELTLEALGATGYAEGIESLRAGDSYEIQLGAHVTVDGKKVKAGERLVVARLAGGALKISFSGSLAAGMSRTVGGKILPGLVPGLESGAEAEALVGMGAKFELILPPGQGRAGMKAQAALAKSAIDTLALAHVAIGVQIANPGGTGPLAGHLLMPSGDELDAIYNNISAIEVSGSADIGINVKLGLAVGRAKIYGAFGEARIEPSQTLRIELNGGADPTLVVSEAFSFEAQGPVGFELAGERMQLDPFRLAGGRGRVIVTHQRRFALGRSLSPEQAAQLMAPGSSDPVKVEPKAMGERVGIVIDCASRTKQGEVGRRYEAAIEDLPVGAAVGRVMARALPGLVGGPDEPIDVKLETRVTPYRRKITRFAPEVSVDGFGAGLAVEISHTKRQEPR